MLIASAMDPDEQRYLEYLERLRVLRFNRTANRFRRKALSYYGCLPIIPRGGQLLPGRRLPLADRGHASLRS